jgi:hypothetical protein
MQSPAGSVQAISAAASTVFSIGIVFLGYWGVHESTQWRPPEMVVAALALFGFIFLGAVPWMATAPMRDPDDASMLRLARRSFLIGVIAMWLAVVVSLFA